MLVRWYAFHVNDPIYIFNNNNRCNIANIEFFKNPVLTNLYATRSVITHMQDIQLVCWNGEVQNVQMSTRPRESQWCWHVLDFHWMANTGCTWSESWEDMRGGICIFGIPITIIECAVSFRISNKLFHVTFIKNQILN